MAALDYLGRSLAKVFFVLHISLDLADGLFVARNLHFFVQVHLLGCLLALELKDSRFLFVYLGFYSQTGELFKYCDSVCEPGRLCKGVERRNLVGDVLKRRGFNACNLYCNQLNILDGDKPGFEFVPESSKIVVAAKAGFKIKSKLV